MGEIYKLNGSKKERLTVYLNSEVLKRIKIEAIHKSYSVSLLVEEILRKYLKEGGDK